MVVPYYEVFLGSKSFRGCWAVPVPEWSCSKEVPDALFYFQTGFWGRSWWQTFREHYLLELPAVRG